MNTEIKEKWVKALRSGKYIQGRFQLRQPNNSMCCLGVLCDLIDPSKWSNNGKWLYSDKFEMPPIKLLDFVGITNAEAERLAGLNDHQGYTFPQIADYIKSNF